MAKPLTLPLATRGYYTIHLLANGCTLPLTTLNQHNHYRHKRKPNVYLYVTKVGFDYGLLT